jgi:bifunctional enzyme CysN/CysC
MAAGMLKFATAGSVDDGKSTLIGRLLMDTHAILSDQLAAVARASRHRGDAYLDLALFTDGLRAEREQGITIDVAYRYFSTPTRKFVIADTPGHEQYTRNMISGTSSVDLVVVLLDARKSVLTQSRRHSFIASLLQVPHVVVAVNKMDLVAYDAAVFRAIVDEYQAFAARLSIRDVAYIPISALHGDNVVQRTDAMPWYEGPTLLHHLEHVNAAGSENLVDFRLPVQLAMRPHQDFRGAAGLVASGSIRTGEEIVVLPSGRASVVKRLATFRGDLNEAVAGDCVVLATEDDLDIGRGDLLVRRHNLPHAADRIDCILCWMSDEPLRPDADYVVQHTTRTVRARVSRVNYRINVDTLHREAVQTLGLNEIGRASLTMPQPLFFDPYPLNRATGGFILVDPHTNNTAAAGIILRQSRDVGDIAVRTPDRRRSPHVTWEGSAVDRRMREARNRHRAAVVWLTGLSGAGKSTIARRLERLLFFRGVQTFLLDGDAVRHGLNGDLAFSDADRRENVRRIAEVARLAFDQGAVVICALISPFRRDRAFARSLVPDGRFLEAYARCDVEVCRARDPKGLYAKAMAGELSAFTGVSSPYEAPESPELILDTTRTGVEESVQALLDALSARGLLARAGDRPDA